MHLASLIGHTHEILQIILSSQKPADSLIDTFFRSRKYLGSTDRRFIAEQTYAVLRHLRRYDFIVDQAALDFQGTITDEDKLYLMIAASLDAVRFTPDHCVGALQDKIVNAQLSSFLHKLLPRIAQGNIQYPAAPLDRIILEYSYPRWMVERFIEEYGERETVALCRSLNEPAPLVLRVNILKTTVSQCRQRLQEDGVETEPTTLSPFGVIVPKRINIFSHASFHDGWFEVQDEGSQLLPLLIDPKPNVRLLDACAGAGGKTLEISALMKNRGEILATDIQQFRLEELKKRAKRSGSQNIRIRNVSTLDELTEEYSEYFDVVLVDAPCSGLGTMRRNPGMKWNVTEQTVAEIREKQRGILNSAAPLVKNNGVLAYATCTLLRSENEDQADRFLADHQDFAKDELHRSGQWQTNIQEPSGFYKLFPHKHGTDGFFCAVFRKAR